MFRTLIMFLSAVGLVLSQQVLALGLGEISLNSSLNQPLDAEVEMLNVEELVQSEIIVALASPEDFERAGVDREFFLTNLHFKVVIPAHGKPHIQISTRQPVPEPYLNFLIEVQWPSGRLLREYTVLLDLPIFSDEEPATTVTPAQVTAAPVKKSVTTAAPKAVKAAPVAAPQVASPSAPKQKATKPAPAQKPAPAPRKAAPKTSAPVAQIHGDVYGPTRSSDTMWGLALKLRPDSSVSVHQTMVALRDLNPDAFINGNINLLRRGRTMQIPTLDQIRKVSQIEAVQAVTKDNKRLSDKGADKTADDDVETKPQLDARNRETVEKAEKTQYSEGYLKLTAPNQAATTGTGVGGKGSSSEDQLAVVQENLASSRRESDDLKTRLVDLEAQVETMQKLIKLKDEELAAMQQTSGKINTPTEQTEEKATAPTAETAPAPQQQPPVETTPAAESQATTAEQPATTPQTIATPQGGAFDQQPEQPAVAVAETVAEQSQPVKTIVNQKPEISLVEKITGNPIFLGFIALALISIVVGTYLVRRRPDAEHAEEAKQDSRAEAFAGEGDVESLHDLTFPEDPAHEVNKQTSALSVDDALSEFETNLSSDSSGFGSLGFEQGQPQNSNTADAIGEADIYIAYGRFQQAIDLLQDAINNNQNAIDVRQKLLEVYVETQDQPGFDKQYAEIIALGNDAAVAEAATKRKGLTGVSEFDPSAFKAGAVASKPQDTKPPESDFAIDEDFSIDLDLGIDETLDEPRTEAIAPDADPEDADDILDFDLTLDEELEAPREPLDLESSLAKSSATQTESSGLGFEIDGDQSVDMAALDREVESLFHVDDEPALQPAKDTAVKSAAKAESLFDSDSFLGDVFEESVLEESALAAKTLPEDESADSFFSSTSDVALPDALSDKPSDVKETVGLGEMSLDFDLSLEEANSTSADADLSLDLSEEQVASAYLDSADTSFDMSAEKEDEFGYGEVSNELESLSQYTEKSYSESATASQSMERPREKSEVSLGDDKPIKIGAVVDSLADNPFAEDQNSSNDDDFNFLADGDEVTTKLDLARAYIDMGDRDGAKDILDEVLDEGDDDQCNLARELLAKLA